MQESAHPLLGIAILVALVALLAAIPVTLLLITRRRQQGIRGATDAAWSGAVTDVEVRSMRVKVGSFTEELPYLVLHYRTRDGLAGSVSVGDSRTAGALSMTTAQPMPPPGYYEEVSSWREGTAITKPQGEYYPRRSG